jgi:hypothetical protein
LRTKSESIPGSFRAEGLPLLLLDGETVMAGRYQTALNWTGLVIPLEKVGLASARLLWW